MDINFKRIFIPAIIALLSTSILFIIREISFRLLHRWAEKTETKIDNIIIKALKIPSIYWCIAIGLYIGVAISELPERYVFYFSKTIHVIVILSVTIATANLSGKIFKNYIQKSNLPIPTTGLDELRKRIFRRFREEGIEIPFPHRTVYLREEKDWQA